MKRSIIIVIILLLLLIPSCFSSRETKPYIPPAVDTLVPPPTRTPSPTAPYIGCVNTQGLWVRNGPGNDYDKIGALEAGECIFVWGFNEDRSWAELRGGGWISTEYIDIVTTSGQAPLSQITLAPPAEGSKDQP